MHLPVIVTVVIGEGGSGGAPALAVADVVMMLENSIYSVITPEAVRQSSDASKAEQAAESLRLTAQDLSELKAWTGHPRAARGRHRDPEKRPAGSRHRRAPPPGPDRPSKQELLDRRLEKYLKMGVYLEETTTAAVPQAEETERPCPRRTSKAIRRGIRRGRADQRTAPRDLVRPRCRQDLE
jgi:acetyl-CoA carboxylase alpha subunit